MLFAAIGLLRLASAVGWAVQEHRYSLKYQTVVAGCDTVCKKRVLNDFIFPKIYTVVVFGPGISNQAYRCQ